MTNRSPSTAKPKKRHSADVLPLDAWRDVLLTRRALAGDVDACLEWLHKYDPASREAIELAREK